MIPIRIGTMAVQPIVSQVFTIRINTAVTGSGTVSSTNQFQLPALGAYTVFWGDGTRESVTASGSGQYVTHTYPSPGLYFVNVIWQDGSLEKRMYFNNSGDRNKLIDITRWGITVWTSMQSAFHGCENLTGSFQDRPILVSANSMAFMFSGASQFNGDVTSWDVSAITNMSSLFQKAASFNRDIGLWNVSLVQNMSNMFDGCVSFDQDISAWDVGAVTDMSAMFFGASIFDQNISVWDTSACLNMADMFRSAVAFNQNISIWTTNAVTNMSGMFRNAEAFNQNIGSWNTAAVTNMSGMFQQANAFNQNIGTWDTSAVVDMSEMFTLNTIFNQNIGSWDTSSVTDMTNMFKQASAFNQNIGSWDVSSVTSLSGMFNNADAFDQNIGSWNVASVTDFVEFMANKSDLDFSTTNLDAIYNGWTNYQLQTGKSISFGTIKYTAAATESRALLTRADTTKAITNAQDNGSGLIRITATAHGLSNGNKAFIFGVTGTTEANGAWIVTVVDPDTIDLQGSTYANAYVSGGTLITGYGWSVADGGI